MNNGIFDKYRKIFLRSSKRNVSRGMTDHKNDVHFKSIHTTHKCVASNRLQGNSE